MPMLIKTIDQILDEEKRDMYFIQFGHPFERLDQAGKALMRQHLEWFKSKSLGHAIAAPRGWLCGDPRCRAVYFDGAGDPRVAEYSGKFEDTSGKSLDPGRYQMVLFSYQAWLEGDGPRHVNGDLAAGDDF